MITILARKFFDKLGSKYLDASDVRLTIERYQDGILITDLDSDVRYILPVEVFTGISLEEKVVE